MTLVIVACAGPTPAPSSPPATASPLASVASASASAVSTIPPAAPGETPPDATLAAEGGDPVTAQIGTYTWREGGSDSPWLPGARMVVGAGEPLTVRLAPPVGIASWRARLVPATVDGPAGAAILGQGSGPLVFAAPAPGGWTVQVAITFADGLGEATYFWRLEVS